MRNRKFIQHLVHGARPKSLRIYGTVAHKKADDTYIVKTLAGAYVEVAADAPWSIGARVKVENNRITGNAGAGKVTYLEG